MIHINGGKLGSVYTEQLKGHGDGGEGRREEQEDESICLLAC